MYVKALIKINLILCKIFIKKQNRIFLINFFNLFINLSNHINKQSDYFNETNTNYLMKSTTLDTNLVRLIGSAAISE